jgi:hypothetical protein
MLPEPPLAAASLRNIENCFIKSILVIKAASGWLQRLVRCSASSGLKPVHVAVKGPHKGGDEPIPHRGETIQCCELESFLVPRAQNACAQQYEGRRDNKDSRRGDNDEQSAKNGNNETTQ